MDWKNDEVLKNLIEKGKQIRVAHLRRAERRPARRRVRSGPPPGHPRTARQERHQRHRRRRGRGRRGRRRPRWSRRCSSPTPRRPATRTPTATAGTSTTRSACTSPRWARSTCSTASRKSSLAMKIELTRRRFRRKVLECDYALRQVTETLKRVHSGDLPFDRTIKVSQTENLEKDKILAADAAQPADARTADGGERRGLPAADRRAHARRRRRRSSASGSGSAAARPSRWSRNSRSARRRSSR